MGGGVFDDGFTGVPTRRVGEDADGPACGVPSIPRTADGGADCTFDSLSLSLSLCACAVGVASVRASWDERKGFSIIMYIRTRKCPNTRRGAFLGLSWSRWEMFPAAGCFDKASGRVLVGTWLIAAQQSAASIPLD